MNKNLGILFDNPVFSIAKKEVMDNIRNKWVVIITIVFTSLALLASYAGSIFSSGWQGFGLTIAAMSQIAVYIISIIALMLGYSAIIGEVERGSMNSLLTLPVTRLEILIGKLIGLGIILATSIFIGFGLAGIIIGFNVPNPNYGEYLFFIAVSLFMALTFLSLGLLVSCTFKKRSTAMGGAIFIWIFFVILWIFITAAILLLTTDIANDPSAVATLPDYYYSIQFLNPTGPYGGLISLNIEAAATGSSEIPQVAYPSFYTTELNLLAELLWFILPLTLAYYLFKRKDI
jgi:Cu-processing system permease protein